MVLNEDNPRITIQPEDRRINCIIEVISRKEWKWGGLIYMFGTN
jgi:hypothetical protein